MPIGTTGGRSGGSGDGEDMGYLFYTRPALTAPAAISTNTAAAVTGHSVTLLDQEEIPGRIYAGIDFTSEWAGAVEFGAEWTQGGSNEVETAEVDLVTTHAFNGKSLVHTRRTFRPLRKSTTVHVSLSDFLSFSKVQIGTFTAQDGSMVEITAADLAGPTEITYEMVFKIVRNGSDIAYTLQRLEFENPQTRSYQIRHEAGG